MNLEHGFEHKAPWLFWLFVASGIVIGMVMKLLVFRTNRVHVEERKNKIE